MGDTGLIHYLVDRGFDIHEKNEEGVTSLQMARDISDQGQRNGLLAALHRKPPDQELISEGKL